MYELKCMCSLPVLSMLCAVELVILPDVVVWLLSWCCVVLQLLFQMYSVLRSMYKDQEPYPSDLYDDLPS